MALELKQHLKLAQQLIMTPQLQQAIKLLQLSRLELKEYIDSELEQNPLLEADTTKVRDETPEAIAERQQLKQRWDAYLETYGQDNIPYYEDDERPSIESTTSKPEGLLDHLLWQIRMNDFTDKEREVGLFIIGNLDHNGFLSLDTQAICQETGADPEVVESAIAKVQRFDPPGIAARDLKDCLQIQARLLGLEDSLVWRIIGSHLSDLQTKNYHKIAQELSSTVEEVANAARIIVNMEPRPARDYSDEPPQYVVPDVYVVKLEGEYVVVLNEDELPMLKLNREYQSMMKSEAMGKMARDYLTECYKSAQWLLKSIQQRQNTLCKVTESIVKFQREFLDQGITHLKPLVLRDVADDVGMHESTISRVTSNKYVHTPQGTFELKYFFNSGISKSDGSFVASQSVKNEIENIIKAEDVKHPLSDQAIAHILKGKGVRIARRTVAKYRELLGILPSNQRKKHF
ncbi:MAG TPA: RNA polymerase factor sigma-54 [Deltaproteobacteria bacterium]|nr:RNA polymerase factor sigma-54 [Deltaproteobacteria bacterium]HQI81068.1 RNA polymerase factor sigma-54 [Deltaproteobacteria bacterium]